MGADWRAYASGLENGLEAALEGEDEREARLYAERLERVHAALQTAAAGQRALNAILEAEIGSFAAAYPAAAEALRLADALEGEEE